MEPEQRQPIIDSLFEMAWSDGSVSNVEKSTINKILVRLGLPLGEAMREMGKRLEAPPEQVDLESAISDRQTRLEVVKFLIAICFCDEELDPAELSLIERLALQFHIGADELDSLRVKALGILSPEAKSSDTGSLTGVKGKDKEKTEARRAIRLEGSSS